MIAIVDVPLRVFLQRCYNLAVFGAVTEQELVLPTSTYTGRHVPRHAFPEGSFSSRALLVCVSIKHCLAYM